MNPQTSQKEDIQTTETGFRYERGSSLSIFKSDRREDIAALIFACLIALGVYANVNYGWGFARLRAFFGL
jgi:hypothetical protein